MVDFLKVDGGGLGKEIREGWRKVGGEEGWVWGKGEGKGIALERVGLFEPGCQDAVNRRLGPIPILTD